MADTKISALTAVTTPAGTDEFAVNQGGTSKKMTFDHIAGGEFVCLSADYTLTSQTAAQKIFNATTNGTLTLNANTTFFYEAVIVITTMSATSGNCGFDVKGGGTATISSSNVIVYGLDATTQSTPAAIGGVQIQGTGQAGNVVVAAVGTAVHLFIKGVIRVTTAGTIIPSVSLTTAAAAVVKANSWFRIWPVGTDTVTTVGNWS